MSKPLSTMFAIGCLLSTGGPFFSRFIIHMPDALTGFLTGLGLALMILVLVKHQRGQRLCLPFSRNVES